jgi:putative ABC transport system ATP-binding protein
MSLLILEFKDVTYINNNKTILKNISLDITSGDFMSIIGPSGSGKSTFLKLCSHLISPTSGNITYKDIDIMQYNPTELRKEIAYCFQTPHLFSNTVFDNISFPYSIRNLKVDIKRVEELFSIFNLYKEYIRKEVKNLSGGEKQRIALIRTLLFLPKILLLDEITSALDVENAKIVEDVITKLNNEGLTVLWITHNLEQSKKHANKILTIENGLIKSLEVLR